MPAQLMALTDGPNILLDKPILLFGRSPECDIQIDSRKISRRHCCIAQVNDYLVVRDLGSTNGVRVNGIRVTEGRLRSGDEVTIGNHRYQVRWDPLENRSSRQISMAAEPEQSRGVVEDDDELLESCDEPVPLEEPDGTPQRGVVPPQPANPLMRTAVTAEKPNLPNRPGRSLSLDRTEQPAIPDNLNLAPASDSAQRHRGKSAPPS